MADFLEPVSRFGSRALRRRIGPDPIGVFSLNFFQLIHQLVVFRIADDRRIEHMIPIIVLVDLSFKFFVTRANGLVGHVEIIAQLTNANGASKTFRVL